ncbi:MAG: TIGR02453 family protein [Acidobacteria bacterium]|nr:TIGR02453 family protein [Acidobacteriota bacterium]
MLGAERKDTVTKRHFSPSLFKFLNDLEQNNEKAWWAENKDRYIEVIREPALEFINDFDAHIKKISPHFTADSRTVGGSLMRPYRDVRFSKDKTPYKTNVGIQFRHEAGKDIHAPGFYLHLEPRACFAGVGLWHPETAVTRRIRQAMNDDPAGWKKAAKGKAFTNTWSTTQDDDEMLKRVPKELDADHPYADDLRMKSFIAGSRLSQSMVTSNGFDVELARMFQKADNFTRFLCDAIGVAF